MAKYIRSNVYRDGLLCGEFREEHVGKRVTASGWVHKYRDLGGILFVDLRDRTGIVQVVFDPERSGKTAHDLAGTLRREDVVTVSGKVERRGEDTINPKMPTGQVEIDADSLTVLSKSKTPPFDIEDAIETSEDTRLKYRYLDLRRPEMQSALATRSKAIIAARRYLDENGFIEVETPFFGKSTPEGARDYLVPCRVAPGKFYALPQSPQMYKQLLMVAGLDRYYQLARCMRDEDLRADRQPEFTQLDVEMSFSTQDDVFHFMEGAIHEMFQSGIGVDVPVPFKRITYTDCINKYGEDKPDMRFDLELVDITDIAEKCGFGVFANVVKSGGIVKGVKAEGWGANKSNQYFNKQAVAEIKPLGAKGLAWLKVPSEKDDNPDGRPLISSIAKFFSDDELAAIRDRFDAKPGDVLMFVADRPRIVHASLAYWRNRIGEENGWKDKSRFAFVWVTDFPLFAYDDAEKRWVSEHHPFTSPREADIDKIESDPGSVMSSSYDCVLNGYEVASGSIRIHNTELQKRIFRRLNLSDDDIKRKFGFFADALSYGTPPHAGIAFGLDRVIAVMLKKDNIREVIAFPKTTRGTDLMSGAPSEVDDSQLRELRIKLDLDE